MAQFATATQQVQDKYRWSLSADDCAKEMFAARDRYRDALKSGDMYPRWVRAHRCYHAFADGQSGDGSFLGRRGSKGQRAVTRNSRTATDARHAISIISQAVPSLEGLPANSAPETLAQVRLVKRLFDYYMERRQLGREYYTAAVGSFRFGTHWIFFDWDPFAGEPLPSPEAYGQLQDQTAMQDPTGPAEPGVMRQTTGDVIYRARSPLQVVIDLFQPGQHDWQMVADPMNRWELAARYPGYEDEIKKLPSLAQDDNAWGDDFQLTAKNRKSDSDLVRVWTLYHRKCRAMPEGRMLCAAAADLWLFDGPLPYDEVPSVELVAGDKIEGTPWADSPMFHATGTQTAIDRAMSAWVTNVLATGHQLVSITDPKFEMAELSDGVSAIINKPGVEGGEPKGITLTAPQVEQQRLIDVLKQDVDGTFATNSVIRGEPDANIRSGAFAGLLVQQAVQYHNPAQYSFQRAVEQGGNIILAILKRFADKPLIAELAGPGGQWRQRAFSQQDLTGIHRVYAKPGNPAERTSAFRKSIADELLANKLITSRAEYMAMIATNQPELADEDEETQEIAILQQREDLLNGKVPPALETDDHMRYIQKFAALLDSPDARADKGLIQRVGAAIAQHLQMQMMQPPQLAAALGRPPPMPPMPGGPGQSGAPGAPQQQTAPHPAASPSGRPPPHKNGPLPPEHTPEPARAGP